MYTNLCSTDTLTVCFKLLICNNNLVLSIHSYIVTLYYSIINIYVYIGCVSVCVYKSFEKVCNFQYFVTTYDFST